MTNYIGSTILNTFIDDRAKWVVQIFCKPKATHNIYAARGTAIEAGVNALNVDLAEKEYHKLVKKYKLDLSLPDFKGLPLSDTDWVAQVRGCTSKAILELGDDIKAGKIDTQKEFRKKISGLECRALLDYYYPAEHKATDLKTKHSGKLPKLVTIGKRKGMLNSFCNKNVRQQVFYSLVGDLKETSLLYITPEESLLYTLSPEDYCEHMDLIKKSLDEMSECLTKGLDWCINNIEAPKESSFKWGFWSAEEINFAKELWDLNVTEELVEADLGNTIDNFIL